MSEDLNVVEKAALSQTEGARARLARALLRSLAPRDENTAAWFNPAASLVDQYLADVQGSVPDAPSTPFAPPHVAGEAHDDRLDDDPTLAEIRRRRREIESGEASILEDGLIVKELKRRLGFGE